MSEKARNIRNVLIKQSLNSCFLFFYSFKSGVESEIFLSYNFSLTFVFFCFFYYYYLSTGTDSAACLASKYYRLKTCYGALQTDAEKSCYTAIIRCEF